MKQWLGWMRDPTLHLIALAIAVLGAFVGVSSPSWWWSSSDRPEHPANCHACSMCPPDVAATRDAFLIRTGSIESPDASE